MSSFRKLVVGIGNSKRRVSPVRLRDGNIVPQKRYSSHVVRDGRPFRAAVIGSGPAGFYTAFKVMSTIQNSVIDMYEHLPVPFGLVRFGVAPDHPEVKKCQDKFAEVASSPRFNFIGNVDVGKDLSLASLKNHYNAVLFAYGASKDRKLAIKGENLKGVYSARDFVGWYNGLPEHADLEPDLQSDQAVIIGQGNVALDVARTLLTDVDVLRKTDMTDNALATLAKSKVKRVGVIGRRGPMQAAFTIKEARELINLPFVSFDSIPRDYFPPDISKLPRTPKRLAQLLTKGSSSDLAKARKSWSLDFLLSPSEFQHSPEDSERLSSIMFQRNKFPDADMYEPSARVFPTETQTSFPTNLAFRSIGYKSEPLQGMDDIGVSFDENRGIIPNDGYGRITAPAVDRSGTKVLPGLYCSGWVKRGPAGVIANTMEDAFSTAEVIADDWENKASLTGGDGWNSLKREVEKRGLRSVSWNDWLRIDAAEQARGKARGKEREKFGSVPEMLSVLD